jgi:hypothetical protein
MVLAPRGVKRHQRQREGGGDAAQYGSLRCGLPDAGCGRGGAYGDSEAPAQYGSDIPLPVASPELLTPATTCTM